MASSILKGLVANNGIERMFVCMAYCAIGRTYCNHHFDASGTPKALFDELAERPLMSPLAGTITHYVRLTIVKFSRFLKATVPPH